MDFTSVMLRLSQRLKLIMEASMATPDTILVHMVTALLLLPTLMDMPVQPTTDPMPTVDLTSVMLKPIQRLMLTMLDTMDTQAMLTVALPHTAMHPMHMAYTTFNFSKIVRSNLSATCMQVLLLNEEDFRKCPSTMHSVSPFPEFIIMLLSKAFSEHNMCRSLM